jgi:hypothetical protein
MQTKWSVKSQKYYMEYIKALFDIRKLPAKFFLLFSIVSGFVLFASDPLLETFHIKEIESKHGAYVGIIFLVSAGMVVINTFLWLVRKNTRRKWKKERHEKVLKFIKTLTPAEKSVLREFLVPQMRTISAPLDDPTVSGLLHKDILYIAMSMGGSSALMQGTSMSVSIADDVLELISFGDVDIAGIPTHDDLDYINSNRPRWVPKFSSFLLKGA